MALGTQMGPTNVRLQLKATAEGVEFVMTASGPPRVRVYALTQSGVIGKTINGHVATLREVLSSSTHSLACFDCGSDKCTGYVDESCPGRPRRSSRICPVVQCQKRIFDSKPTGRFLEEDGESVEWQGTVSSRTQDRMNAHIAGYHRDEAVKLGLIPEFRKNRGN